MLDFPWGSLIRYNSDGTIDETFGDRGVVNFLDGSGDGVLSRVLALTVQSDRRIVAGGDVYITASNSFGPAHFAVARYSSDGKPDLSFGAGGIVRIERFSGYPGAHEIVTGVDLEPDGKIVALGITSLSPAGRLSARSV